MRAALLYEAESALIRALELGGALHQPGARESYRQLLAYAIDSAERALALPRDEPAGALSSLDDTSAALHVLLAKANAARAEDALHGAGQLSQSAQRAPTYEDCEQGWGRVESIVRVAERAAHLAAESSDVLEGARPGSRLERAARAAARSAEAAASSARRVVAQRNHAYTFHADSRFSFGEGWYLAAAAVLAGVAIQIEPDKDLTAQAERFLFDAGLRDRCQPYRPRPRAMKHTTHVIARAFRRDPQAAQQRLRAAFLGEEPIPPDVSEWIERRLEGAPEGKRVLLWIRSGVHHPDRNTDSAELCALAQRARSAGLVPILTGDPLLEGELPADAVDMILFWKDPVFRGISMRRAQLSFFECLRRSHGLVGQVGVTTAGMDGPALLGLPTMYLTAESNVRMREWVGAVPGYREIVRAPDYLDGITAVLDEWSRSSP